jgi:hypothetical protein
MPLNISEIQYGFPGQTMNTRIGSSIWKRSSWYRNCGSTGRSQDEFVLYLPTIMNDFRLENNKHISIRRAIKYYAEPAKCMRKMGLTYAEYVDMLKKLVVRTKPLGKQEPQDQRNMSLLDRRFDQLSSPGHIMGWQDPSPQPTGGRGSSGNQQLFSRTFDMAPGGVPYVGIERQSMGCRRQGN